MLGDTDVKTLGAFEAVVAKAKECAPCVLLLRHVEVFGRKANAQEHGTGEISLTPPCTKPSSVAQFADTLHCLHGSEPALSSRLSTLPVELQQAAVTIGWPILLVGTTDEEDGLAEGTTNAFKQTVHISVSGLRCWPTIMRSFLTIIRCGRHLMKRNASES
jgi:peroxin-6